MTPFIRLRSKTNERGHFFEKTNYSACTIARHATVTSSIAASPRVMTILPAISFDGTTANCRVSVSADRSTDQISAVIQLWNGSTRIARWTDSGTGYLLFSNSATVSKGKTYELTVDVKINGVSKPQVSIEGTCK